MREVVCVNCGEPLPEHKRSQAKYCSDLCGSRARVISNRANLLKSNATLEELTLVLEDAMRLHKGGGNEGDSL